MLRNPYAQQFTITDPKIPFDMNIPNRLTEGKQIHIKGHVLPKSADFRIDFLTPQNFIALHINPRFSQNAIVRNTDRGGWGAEERDGRFPFKQGQPFDMTISVELDQYKVLVNGEHNFNYRHRIPFGEVTKLAFNGQVEIRNITFIESGVPRGQINNPVVPSTLPINYGIQQGKLIQITGQVPKIASRFTINLQSGPTAPARDIALHFNPRWDNGPHPVVVRNTLSGGSWGNEERDMPFFPFTKGAAFEILIFCDSTDFKVAVNGQHFIAYRHRVPFRQVNYIGFDGTVSISAVRQFN